MKQKKETICPFGGAFTVEDQKTLMTQGLKKLLLHSQKEIEVLEGQTKRNKTTLKALNLRIKINIKEIEGCKTQEDLINITFKHARELKENKV